MLAKNVGTADRVVRVIIGITLLVFLFWSDSPWRWAGLIGIVPLLTAFLGSCPLYSVLGLTTCPLEHKSAA